MSAVARAVNAAMRADWATSERHEAIVERNRWVWDCHHVEGVPGRQIPGRFLAELRERALSEVEVVRMSIAYATVRKIIEGPRP